MNRRILELRLEGYSYKEIGQYLDISLMTAKRRLEAMYEVSNKEIKNKLDYIKEINIIKKFLKKK